MWSANSIGSIRALLARYVRDLIEPEADDADPVTNTYDDDPAHYRCGL